jgi:hypothetical protein
MHYQDHPVPKFNIDLERDRLTASQEDHTGATALVPDLPISQDKEPHLAGAFNDDFDSDHKTTGSQDLAVHSDRVELDLRVL